MSSSRTLPPADITLDAEGRLYSPRHNDIYHARAGAWGQAQYVFLQGNGLPERWRGRRRFTVCETGFGIGLSFLALWQAWRADPQRSRRLHMLSIEGYPLARQALAVAVREHLPELLRPLGEALLAQWPALLPGLHRLEFDEGAVTLTLAFGDAAVVAPRLSARVDAYFLDGFAPSRNPDMWAPSLLAQLARLAAPDATLATWTAAGHVRRALVDAGFEVRRIPGFGGKAQMTVGMRAPGVAARAPDLPDDDGADVLVVGGGLAGAGIAQALALRGRQVMVLADDGGGDVHAAHPAAALTPLISRDDNARARLSRAGSQRALRRWSSLGQAAPLRCGTLQLARDEGRAMALFDAVAASGLPEDWVRAVDRNAACALAGLSVARGGAFFSDGLLVRPGALIQGLLGTAGVTCRRARVAAIAPWGAGWRVFDTAGAVLAEAPQLVLANAMGVLPLLAPGGWLNGLPRLAQMHALAGEVTLLPADQLSGGPRCIVGGEGYLLPALDGWCVAGSTYVHGATQSCVGSEGQHVNLGKAQGLLGWPLAFPSPGNWPGWAGWRAVLPGRLPAIGQVPEASGLWLATGYASRGLTWSALAGDLIAAQLCGEPLPLETDLMTQIAPR